MKYKVKEIQIIAGIDGSGQVMSFTSTGVYFKKVQEVKYKGIKRLFRKLLHKPLTYTISSLEVKL